MHPKEFINKVLIEEIGDIKNKHPYLAFLLICSAIEFLGKCLSDDTDWHKYKQEYFSNAINELFPDSYRKKINPKEGQDTLAGKMRTSLRNGMVHALLPDSGIGLTELKHDPDVKITRDNHPYEEDGTHIFVIEYFYDDFVDACREVVKTRKNSDKFSKKILEVPKSTEEELADIFNTSFQSTPATGYGSDSKIQEQIVDIQERRNKDSK